MTGGEPVQVTSAGPVVVRVVPTRMWHALLDDEVAGRAHVVQRPDRRYFVAVDAWRTDVFDALLDAVLDELPHDLATIVAEPDVDELGRWTRRGFEERRREDEYEIDVRDVPRAVPVPPGYVLVRAVDADPDALRHLDDEIRQDVAATRGWVSDPDEFAEQVLRSPFFDPATCLVAVEESTGAYAGLVRVGVARRWARLALVGVRTGHRRQGLARALVTAALRPLPERGVDVVLAEADAAAVPTRALLAALAARRTGGIVELVRPARSG